MPKTQGQKRPHLVNLKKQRLKGPKCQCNQDLAPGNSPSNRQRAPLSKLR